VVLMAVELLKDVVARWSVNYVENDDDDSCSDGCECEDCLWCSCCEENYNSCRCRHPYGDWCDEEEDE